MDAIHTCTKTERVQQLSAPVSQRLAFAFPEEELEAALRVRQLGSSLAISNFIMCGVGEHTWSFLI